MGQFCLLYMGKMDFRILGWLNKSGLKGKV